MAIDRPDDNSSADDGRDRQPDRPDHADRGGRDGVDNRRVPEEQRGRADLYADLRAAERGGQPPDRDEPRTTDDGGWEWKGLRLSPDANGVADREISERRSAEGRDTDGTYEDQGITPAMRRVEAQLDHGSLVPDTEKFALKSPDRFKEKLAKLVTRYPDRSPDQLASLIHDGIRYTFVFDTQNYVSGLEHAKEKLADEGYTLRLLKPSWDDPDYKGVNSRWQDPASQRLFEVQFHTQESWEAKQRTHDAYEKLADPRTTGKQRDLLEEEQRKITASIAIPPGATDIAHYKAKDSDG